MPSWTTPNDFATGHLVTNTDWNLFNGTNGDVAFLFGDANWTNVTAFTNSYTATAVTPRYILIGRTVVLQGAVTGGTANTSAFTLPVGYRPTENCNFAVVGNNLFCILTVLPSGTVTPVTTGTSVNLNVSFPAV